MLKLFPLVIKSFALLLLLVFSRTVFALDPYQRELLEATQTGDEEKLLFLLHHKDNDKTNVNIKDSDKNSLLRIATNLRHYSIMTALINAGLNINAKNKYGNSALSIAVANGDIVATEILLAHRAKVTIRNNNGYNPIMIASDNGFVDILMLLVESLEEEHDLPPSTDEQTDDALNEMDLIEADIIDEEAIIRDNSNSNYSNSQNIAGYMAIMDTDNPEQKDKAIIDEEARQRKLLKYQEEQEKLYEKEEKRRQEAVQRTEDRRKLDKERAIFINSKMMPLPMFATNRKDRGEKNKYERDLKQEERENKQNFRSLAINKKDDLGNTALKLASFYGNYDVVHYLLGIEGINIDIEDNRGNTPLMAAAYNGYGSIVRLLISKGANYLKRNADGKTAQTFANQERFNHINKYLKDVKKRHDIIMKYCRLIDEAYYNGTLNNLNVNGETILTTAIKYNYKEVIDYYVLSGANINQRNNDGLTPLMIAYDSNKTDIMYTLLDHLANVNEVDYFGTTILMMAVKKGDIDGVELFLNYKADPYVINKEEKTALVFARQGGHTEIETLLQEDFKARKAQDVENENSLSKMRKIYDIDNSLKQTPDKRKRNESKDTVIIIPPVNENSDPLRDRPPEEIPRTLK